MIQVEMPYEGPVFRVKRLGGHFFQSLAASRGVGGKWAMGRCLMGWLLARLGLSGRSKEVTLNLDGLRVVVDVGRNEILPFWELWYENSYELFPQFRATENSCVVDVGGNVGFYAIRHAQRATKGRVLVFEPAPTVFPRLKANLEGNHFHNATVVNAVIGATSGTVHFIESVLSINCRVVEHKTPDSIDVPCMTLDAALSEYGVDRVDILKIDTEGHELAVLAGAKATLPRVRRIVVELHDGRDEEQRQIDKVLLPIGFEALARRGNLAYYERKAVSI